MVAEQGSPKLELARLEDVVHETEQVLRCTGDGAQARLGAWRVTMPLHALRKTPAGRATLCARRVLLQLLVVFQDVLHLAGAAAGEARLLELEQQGFG